MRKKRLKLMIILLIFTVNIVGIASQVGIPTILYQTPRNILSPIAQDYETNSSESVDSVSVTIEQMYKNDTTVAIDQDNTWYTASAPNSTGYETSYSRVSVENIAVENHTLVIEDENDRWGWWDVSNAQPAVTSFLVPNSCYLTNVSVYVRRGTGSTQDGNMSVRLYNSSWTGGVNEPNSNVNQFVELGNVTAGSGWKTINVDTFLDNSNTDNKTWYIGLIDYNTAEYSGEWWYTTDDATGDSLDETDSYIYAGGGNWNLIDDGGVYVDLIAEVGLSLKNSNPAPSVVNLQINGTTANNNTITPTANNGVWESNSRVMGQNNEINFSITADWYTYTLSVNQTLVNYTSTFDAITTYNAESEVDVYWNATSEFEKFDHRLTDNAVNFTIPLNWDTPLLNLDRDSTSVPYSTYTNNSAKIITVRGADAIDGNWTLETTSSNLLSNIDISVGGIETPVAYMNEVLGFNASFSTPVSGIVNLSIYNPETLDDEMVFSFQETITDSDFIDLTTFDIDVDNLTVLSEYGQYRVQVQWDNDTDVGIRDATIILAAQTSYSVISAPGHETLTTAPAYDVHFGYFDEFKGINVTGAQIGSNSSFSWSYETQNNIDGTYNVTIDPSLYAVPGDYEIEITLNKSYYMNYTFNYDFSIVQATQVQKLYSSSNLTVQRGIDAVFKLNYNLTVSGNPVFNGLIQEVSLDSSLTWIPTEDPGTGNYTITIDTSLANANQSPFMCIFNITETGFQTRQFNFTVTVTLAQIDITLNSQTDLIARNSGLNATIYFHVNDTTNNQDLIEIPESNFTVYNHLTSSLWDVGTFNWKMWEISDGDYGVNISLSGLNSGSYTVRLNASKAPNYDFDTLVTSFYIRGNNTLIDIFEFSNNAGILLPKVNDSRQIYLDTSRIGLKLNLNDTEYGNRFISDVEGDFQYWAWFNGTQSLTTSFVYSINDENEGYIVLPSGLIPGNGNITLIIGQTNYENATATFNVTFLDPLQVSFNQILLPSIFTQGNSTSVRFRVTYDNETAQPLVGVQIGLSLNITGFAPLTNTTDADGYVTFTITAPTGNYESMSFILSYNGGRYGIDIGSQSFPVSVVKATNLALWILYAVLSVLGISLAVIAVQQGIIKPRKKKYRELLYNTVAVFEDAINLQHVLIIHKNTGTCVFFKTFGILDIDPDLISGFLSAAQSFVRESMSADGISEIKSGDNHLLISDGELVRVTLVLAKGASQFLRSNTARLVMLFENQYYQELIDWRGSLNIFQNASPLIDETLHTSVILPHQITTSIKILKSIKTQMAQKLLKIARELTTAKRSFFFIAQLVSEAKEKLKKKPPEILLALNELLDMEAISPVDLSGFDEQPISEQEMNLLAQRVMQLPNLTNQERETLVKDLVGMNAAEREAAITSIQQGQKITSDVSHRMITTKMFTSKKDAKAEIGRLVKEGQKMLKERRFQDAILCYETASVTASNWKMPDESKKFRDRALNTQIAAFNDKIRKGQKEVPKLIRQGEEERALNYCEEAYEAASSLFKLGFTEYERTVKKFGGMLQDVRKKLKNYETSEEGIFRDDRKHFEKMERDLLRKAQKLEKDKDFNEAVSLYSELTVIANKIFKFGVISAKDKIKKYKSKVARLKRKALKSAEEGLASLNEEELLDQKAQFLNIALEAEQTQDFLRSIVAYEEAIKIQHKLGDSEGATKLEEKIHLIVTSIPNVERVLSDLLHRAKTHFEQQTFDLAFTEYQYALGVCKALSMRDQIIEITAKLDEISRRL